MSLRDMGPEIIIRENATPRGPKWASQVAKRQKEGWMPSFC